MTEYKVKRIPQNRLQLQGEPINSLWQNAEPCTGFSFPWENQAAPKTSFRALWDEDNFYFRFDVEDENVLTYVDTDHKMEVVNSDRVEIFFRQDEQLNPYYCLEMDARGRILDYTTRYYRKFDYKWSWPSKALTVKACKSQCGYVVEGAITLQSLKDLGLLKNKVLQAGLYRGYCMKIMHPESELRWISWIQPNSKEPDFHIPSSFGRLVLDGQEN